VLANAVEANINAQLPLMYAHMPGVEVIDEPDLLGMMSELADLLFNSITWAAFPPEGIEARIDELLDRFQTQGRLPMSWIVSPATQPRDLGRYLEARGFASVFRGVPGMAVDLECVKETHVTPVGLSIRRVESTAQLRQWLHPVSVGFILWPVCQPGFWSRRAVATVRRPGGWPADGCLPPVLRCGRSGHLSRRHGAGSERAGVRDGDGAGSDVRRAEFGLSRRHSDGIR
jgi:hypothetical protein